MKDIVHQDIGSAVDRNGRVEMTDELHSASFPGGRWLSLKGDTTRVEASLKLKVHYKL